MATRQRENTAGLNDSASNFVGRFSSTTVRELGIGDGCDDKLPRLGLDGRVKVNQVFSQAGLRPVTVERV
jgi:hypothetical protein